MKNILIIAGLTLCCVSAKAEELSIHISRAVYKGFFDTIEAGFEKDTGIKLKYVEDPNKAADVPAIMQNVVDGKADAGIAPIAFAAWLQLMEKSGKPVKDAQAYTSRVIGKDEIVLLAHPKVNVSKVTLEQAVDVFAGKIQNWKELGGQDLKIKLVLPTVAHTKAFMESQILKGKAFAPAAMETEGAPQTIKAVAETEGSFSYTPLSQFGNDTSVKRIATGSFGRPVTLVTKGKPSDNMFKLLKYIGDKQTAKK